MQLLRTHLANRPGAERSLALLETAICTCLRASDLLDLRVGNVLVRDVSHLVIYDTIMVQQLKTNRTVSCDLSDRARAALVTYIKSLTHYAPESRLFPITRVHYGRIVKSWARLLGLDYRQYSTHSLRRTQPAHLYAMTGDVRSAGELLGHTNVSHTGAYLGVDQASAQRRRREHEV